MRSWGSFYVRKASEPCHGSLQGAVHHSGHTDHSQFSEFYKAAIKWKYFTDLKKR